MPEFVIDVNFSNEGTRNDVRMRVVNVLSGEPAGSGSGDMASRFTYNVETLNSGDKIFLRRPANLHNGFDFLVCIENVNFGNGRKRNYPKHEDIIDDLKLKKHESSEKYAMLVNYVKQVYDCNEIDFSKISVNFSTGLSIELILKTLKWLFIEQDIRYWNYSGRDMLWDAIKVIK